VNEHSPRERLSIGHKAQAIGPAPAPSEAAAESEPPDLPRSGAAQVKARYIASRREARNDRNRRAIQRDLFPSIVYRCAGIGAWPGAASGMALVIAMVAQSISTSSPGRLGFVFPALSIAAIVGALVGALVGCVTGIVVAGETCGYFLPPFDARRYRRIITVQCLAIAMTAAALAIRYLLHPDPDGYSPNSRGVLLICSGLSALWGSNKLVKWYEDYAARYAGGVPAPEDPGGDDPLADVGGW
jgi:hypothetical protein